MSEALSGLRLDSEMKLTATELEFLAEDELVDVVPRFKFDALNLIGGTYGPFQPMVPTRVPLWLAMQLVQRNLGKIQPPGWLHEDNVEDLWNKEDRSRDIQHLEEVPFHYQEISTLLLRQCPESFAGQEGM
jgi:GINS complex subunit 2